MRTTDFKVDTIREAFEHFFGSRVIFVCAAGSVVHGRATLTSDIDLMLVLDTHYSSDIALCRSVVRVLGKYYYFVGISLQYLDELPVDPEDVQDGSKGCLALAYINSAYVIMGKNVYKELFRRLPDRAFQRSIIRTLEEYLHRMYALAFNYDEDDEEFKAEALKFLTRSIIDAMLYYHPGDMEPYDKLTHQQILDQFRCSPEIEHITAGITIDSTPIEMVQAMREIIIQLKRSYGILG